MSSWQRLIAALEDGPLRAYEACRQAGYSPNASPHAVLATATAHCPRLCEWVEGAQVWVGLVSPGGEYVIGVDGTDVTCYDSATAVAAKHRSAALSWAGARADASTATPPAPTRERAACYREVNV